MFVMCESSGDQEPRGRLLTRGLRLEYLTVGWNVIEGVIAVAAAITAESVALLGLGIDSFVESASGAVLIWRLISERTAKDREAIERLDRKAHRLVGVSLFALAAYIALDATWTLVRRNQPQPTLVGIGLTAVSIGVMWWLAGAKRRTSIALGSRALAADSFQTTACWWLSLVVLGGIGLNAAFGWWWADPVAALGMTYFLVREGREALQAQEDVDG